MRSLWFLAAFFGICSSFPFSPYHYAPHPQYPPFLSQFQPALYGPFKPILSSARSNAVVTLPSNLGFTNSIGTLQPRPRSNDDTSVLARTIPGFLPTQLSVNYGPYASSNGISSYQPAVSWNNSPLKIRGLNWLDNGLVYDPTFQKASIQFSRTLPPGQAQINNFRTLPSGQAQINNFPVMSRASPQVQGQIKNYPVMSRASSPVHGQINNYPVMSRRLTPEQARMLAKSTLDSLDSRPVESSIEQEQIDHQHSIGRSFFYVPPTSTKRAVVPLVEANGSKVTGNLELFQVTAPFGVSLGVKVRGTIKGLKLGSHGFHVHEGSASSNDCLDAGGHFNPDHTQHGPHTVLDQSFSYDWFGERHAGDLGNVVTQEEGVDTEVRIYDKYLKLGDGSARDVKNLVIVVHADNDDGSKENNGNAGTRVACGVIKLIEA